MNVMSKLPAMTVEQRESTTAHGIPEPTFNRAIELVDTIVLNNEAKNTEVSFTPLTVNILNKYLPFQADGNEMANACIRVLLMDGWAEVSKFVADDMCLDFFNLALRYCLSEGQHHRRDRGFIDGSGIGYVRKYVNRLKETLEQCFDAKYYYKVARPLEDSPIDLSMTANKIHPGHWSYPAGHGTKFLTAVEVLNDVFALDSKCYRELLLAACIASMGRSGSLIHYPSDNLAGGHLTNLKEWA